MLKIACLLLFIGLVASDASLFSVIARILDQAKRSRSRSPVVLVINSRAPQESSSSVELPTFRQSSEEAEGNGLSLLTMLSQLQKSRSKPQYNLPRYQQARKPQKQHHIYKSLLSLRNSLRCGARHECKDECSELPKKKKHRCAKKCEVKYECDEPEDEVEECNDCNETKERKEGSTKGPAASNSEECNNCRH